MKPKADHNGIRWGARVGGIRRHTLRYHGEIRVDGLPFKVWADSVDAWFWVRLKVSTRLRNRDDGREAWFHWVMWTRGCLMEDPETVGAAGRASEQRVAALLDRLCRDLRVRTTAAAEEKGEIL